MSALPKLHSVNEFLEWEERQELRYEFDGVDAQAMTGGTRAHARIQANLMGALYSLLEGGPSFVLGSELKIRTQTTIRYPDAMVVCTPGGAGETWTSEPSVLFEILSPSSAGRDLGAKNADYQTLKSLRRYVVLHQDVAAAEVFFRDHEGEGAHEFVAVGGMLRMPEIGVKVSLAVCYEGPAA